MGNMNELIAMVVFVSWNKLREEHLIMESSSLEVLPPLQEREFFIDNLLVRIHFIIVMIRWTGLAPWEFEFPFRPPESSRPWNKLREEHLIMESSSPAVLPPQAIPRGSAFLGVGQDDWRQDRAARPWRRGGCRR